MKFNVQVFKNQNAEIIAEAGNRFHVLHGHGTRKVCRSITRDVRPSQNHTKIYI